MTTTNTQLKDSLENIANDLTNGIEVTKDNIDIYPDYQVGDYISGYDYLSDVLDIEYRVGSDGRYRSTEVLVAFGGPNIYIDTKSSTVRGYWWNESHEVSYEDNIGLDDTLEELFNS